MSVPHGHWITPYQNSSLPFEILCWEVTRSGNMYDDVDWSGGLLDFDGGGPPISPQHEPMYVDDDTYMDDLYSTDILEDLAMPEMANGEDVETLTYYERISVSDLFDQCVAPTVSQAFFSISTIGGLCVVCRMTCLFCHTGL